MQEEILKSKPVLINIDQNLSFESIFENYASENIKVKIIPATLNEPMEIIIRDVTKPQSFEGKTGTYIPPKADIKPLKRVKGHVVDRVIRKVLG
jgi:hypothetical protein